MNEILCQVSVCQWFVFVVSFPEFFFFYKVFIITGSDTAPFSPVLRAGSAGAAAPCHILTLSIMERT